MAGHDVYAFEARRRRRGAGGTRYLCFYDESTLIASGSLDRLREAADLLAGQGRKLATDSELAQMLTPKAGSVVIAAARNVSELAQGAEGRMARRRPRQAAFLKKAETMRMEIGEANDEVFVAVSATMKAEQDAVNVRNAAQGFLGLLMLSHGEDETVAQVLQSVRIERRENTVNVSMQCPVKDVLDRAEAKMVGRVATRKPSSAPRRH